MQRRVAHLVLLVDNQPHLSIKVRVVLGQQHVQAVVVPGEEILEALLTELDLVVSSNDLVSKALFGFCAHMT